MRCFEAVEHADDVELGVHGNRGSLNDGCALKVNKYDGGHGVEKDTTGSTSDGNRRTCWCGGINFAFIFIIELSDSPASEKAEKKSFKSFSGDIPQNKRKSVNKIIQFIFRESLPSVEKSF